MKTAKLIVTLAFALLAPQAALQVPEPQPAAKPGEERVILSPPPLAAPGGCAGGDLARNCC